MAQTLQAPIHLFDYLAMDDASQYRHEYVAGQVYAKIGGTMRHNRISGNVLRALVTRLERTPCQVIHERHEASRADRRQRVLPRCIRAVRNAGGGR